MIERLSEEITFRKLEILLAYMQAGSLARAAELMQVSSVSIHRALHSLEAAVRCQLFRHEGRNLVPTRATRVLADVAREVLNAMSEGVQATRRAGGYSSDLLRLGSLYSLTTATVPRVIVDLKVRNPKLQVELVLGSNTDLLLKLEQGEIDAALVAVPDAESEIESIPLFEDDIFFAAPVGSKYAAMAAVDLRTCADERFVSLSDGFVTYAGFVEAFRIAQFTPQVVTKVGDIFSLMNLVSGGVGCTLLPGRVRDVFKDKVQLIPLLPEYLMRQVIGLNFLRSRERDPNLLALALVCRRLHRGSDLR
ncbi:MAG: LysR family transcriptional regulator [Burkholderiales bacterium]|nr:LysR family transcriptional regulator [Burkholderiales bacterium]MDE2396955.1 LysR family transcriptional regulator [Burkholderiales bacterium]MDE2454526.1 LysR family transcriptional regulator [Burkholderiales bacterium]